jgi:hypothetical protein
MIKKKKVAAKPKKVAVVKRIKIPAPLLPDAPAPVEGVVVILAKDPVHAETLYQHVSDWLHKVGADLATLIKGDK